MRTKKGILNRPVQKLHLVEEHCDVLTNSLPHLEKDFSVKNNTMPLAGEDVPVRRSKRLRKPVNRL